MEVVADTVHAEGDSLNRGHVWSRHRADFLGFLQGVLLVKSLLFLLLILNVKQKCLLPGSTRELTSIQMLHPDLRGYAGCKMLQTRPGAASKKRLEMKPPELR